jgi:ElaB/YqjD/DUF883 family membrane-anchored ribosome-binding protein
MGEGPDQIGGESSLREHEIRNRRTEEVIGRVTDGVVRDTPGEPARIRSEIARTRDDMSETIDAIQDKLSVRNLAAQARDSVKEATVGRVRQAASSVGEAASSVAVQTRDVAAGVADTVRRNPWPALLIGAGSAWLLMNGTKKKEPEYVRNGPTRASSQIQGLMRRNPLAVGAVAAAVGVVVGLALPETERENRLMGETRDDLVERAQEATQNAVEKVKQVAGEAADKF